MDLYVGYAAAGRAGVDVEVPSVADAAAGAGAHAVGRGSPVALCGAPVGSPTEEVWPPRAAAPCPLCVEVVKGYLH